jgi:hypothetical protein
LADETPVKPVAPVVTGQHMLVKAVGSFDFTKKSLKFSLNVIANDDLTHGLLAALLDSPVPAVVTPKHQAGSLNLDVEFQEDAAFDEFAHNAENARRARVGLPSLEQEAGAAQAKADAEKAQAEAAVKAADDKAKADAAAAAAKDKELDAFASKVAAKISTPAPAAPTKTT